jgi:hypothetical protein
MDIKQYLEDTGPQLASTISTWLEGKGVLPDAARKRISRAKAPIRSFPVPLFPKGARFLYLQKERETERFWSSMLRDLRATGSVYGMALDGLLARKGAILSEEFGVISGATAVPIKKQVTSDTVLQRLMESGLVTQGDSVKGRFIAIRPYDLLVPDLAGMSPRDAVERIILDALREWARNIGLASYNQIAIRGEASRVPVQQFQFDLSGPSYLLPLRRGKQTEPGFLVADVFSDGVLDEHHIRYFLRKARALHSTLKNGTVLPILIANSFTSKALNTGHAAGVMMATPGALFGRKVSGALQSLLVTLTKAGSYASAENPNRIVELVKSLADIEGRSHNLRGPLFELIVAYLARRDAVSIDVGVRATDPTTMEQADIDVLKVKKLGAELVAIECKAREPGGMVGVEEIQHWLKKLRVAQKHLKNRDREAHISFEIWTTGSFTPDARALLEKEQKQRKQSPINWKSGAEVALYASSLREKAVSDVLKQHFVQHPLAKMV